MSTDTMIKPHIDSLERLFTAGGFSHSTESCPASVADLLPGTWADKSDDPGWLCSTCIAVGGQLVGRLTEATARAGVTARDDVDYRPWGDGNGTGGGSRPANPASEKQVALIDSLVARLGESGAALRAAAPAQLTGGRGGSASKLIDALMAARDTAPAGAPETYRWKKVDGEWLVTGPAATIGDTVTISKANGETAQAVVTCELPAGLFRVRKADAVDDENRAESALADADRAEATFVPAGHYALESTGHNDLVFYRVDRPEKGRYVGSVFVKMIVGGKPDTNVARSAVPGILARIAADGPDEAGARYGQEIGRCCRCNRTLTDELSRSLGIGPDCRTKG